MIKIFNSASGKLREIDRIEDTEKGSWIHVVSPTKSEIDLLATNLNIEREYFQYPLDEDEHSRIDQEESQTLIIVNFPVAVPGGYDTYPLGIMMTDKVVITVSAYEPSLFNDFMSGKVKTFDTYKKVRFVLQILYKIAALYMTYLRQIGRKIDYVEEVLKTTTKNEELLKMLNINKSLVYLSTSLRSNQVVLEKIEKIRYFRIYEEDLELLEDTLIENRQSMEMSTIYTNILTGTMEAYASIISNNLNSVMKFLTTATIVIMLPNFIASLYGMNVALPFQNHPVAFWAVLSVCMLVTIVSIIYFVRRKFF
ncbi:MAG: magnesium transporter CorA family protein [Candidatus Caenarcaniphilales bacterium]|nr:magnesium transporter CorA family protein [Candidatus Caenarcaniphilales bacterium]